MKGGGGGERGERCMIAGGRWEERDGREGSRTEV